MSASECIRLALLVISSFPKSYNGKPYLTLKNGKKMFFTIFLKKYWLIGKQANYSITDVARRVRMVEFFDYVCSHYDTKVSDKDRHLVIETVFYRMVIKQITSRKWTMLELLSCYHYK